MKPRCACFAATALAALALACGRETEPTVPGVYSVTGRVVLVGHLVNPLGQFLGDRVVSDADGVAVELLYGTQVIARVTTVDGGYRFTGIGPGGYRARARVIGDIADQTQILTVTAGDLVAGDTLELVPRGDLFPLPNPLAAIGTTLYFELPDTQQVEVRILDGEAVTRRVLLDGVRPLGLNAVAWDGLDADGLPAPAAQYWATLVTPGEPPRAQLLFTRQP